MFARGSALTSCLSDYVKFLEIVFVIFYAFVKESIFQIIEIFDVLFADFYNGVSLNEVSVIFAAFNVSERSILGAELF